MRSNVTFKSNGLKIAGHLYLPDEYKEGEKRPAIVVGHPCGGVKEQTAGLYAKKLSEKGFATALSLISTTVSLVLFIVIPIYYLIPPRTDKPWLWFTRNK
jgi:fermentation-respiration switch protein FrsA (DUF1100 family)